MKRPGLALVAALVIAVIAIIVREPDSPRHLPDDDGPDPSVAASDVAIGAVPKSTLDTDRITARTCKERARERLKRSRELDIPNIVLDAVASLQQSGDSEHVLAAALMSSDRKELQAILDRVLSEDPANRVAHGKNLENCRAVGSECDRRAVEAAVIAVDSANGLVWMDIASAHMLEDRWDHAEDALRRAAVAPRFDTYFMEYALLIERGLAATSDLSYTDRMIAGIGYAAAAATPAYGEVTRGCGGEVVGFSLPADVCFELGEQMARNSRELLAMHIGKHIQQDAARRLGDEGLARQLGREKQALQDAALHASADSGAQVLLQNDATVLQRYIDTFLAHGEIRATEALVAEARRLREDPDYDQCNFVGNPDFERQPTAP